MKPGHVQANAAVDVNIPASRIIAAVDVAKELGDNYAKNPSYVPSIEDQRKALAAGVGLGLSAPGANQDFMLRIGVVRDLDVGVRWSGLAAHVDGKFRFMGDESSWQGAVSLGVSKTLYRGFIFDTLDYLRINDYSRWNVELPVIFGRRLGDFGHVWAGPKYVYSHYTVDASLKNVGAVSSTSGSIHHLGGFGGIALGYKYVFVVAELSIAKMFAQPELFGQTTDLGGIVVVPAFGLMLRL
jgi:hypothetical protein